ERKDTPCSLATFEHGGDDQIRAAHHVTAGEDARMGGLERQLARRRDSHAAIRMQPHPRTRQPRRRTWEKSEGDDHGVGRDDLLTSRYGLRYAPPARAGRSKARLHELHPLDVAGADDLDRLPVEEK